MGANEHLVARPGHSRVVNLKGCSPVLGPGLVLPGFREPWPCGIGLSEPGKIGLSELRDEVGVSERARAGKLLEALTALSHRRRPGNTGLD